MAILRITDSNAALHVRHRLDRLRYPYRRFTDGCLPRYSVFGSIVNVPPTQSIFPRIPRSEWSKLIREGQGSFLSNVVGSALPPHDQGSTNYCWAHGSVRAVELRRYWSYLQSALLSAESVAVPLTGGRNRGGSPDEALTQLQQYGACRQVLWPLNDRNINHAEDGWKDDREYHVILSWLDVENFDDQMTLALHRIPVAIGLRWWSHLVCQLDPLDFGNGNFGILCDNSWGADYGDNGRFELDQKHGTADLGAFAPLSVTLDTRIS